MCISTLHIKKLDLGGMIGASGLIVVDGGNAHIIDTPWTQEDTETLIRWIKAKELIIKSTIITHFHEDASGGIPFLNNSNIKTYATTLTNTQNNIVVWPPKQKILFGGCFVESINSKNIGNMEDASVKDWPKSIQKVIDKYQNIKISTL
jgi:beta-lactamase superfamily II metal-dependent hydrolase